MITELNGKELAEQIVKGYSKRNLRPTKYSLMDYMHDRCCGMGIYILEALSISPIEFINKIEDLENKESYNSLNKWICESIDKSEDYISGFEGAFDRYYRGLDYIYGNKHEDMSKDFKKGWEDGKLVAEKVTEYWEENYA